MATRETLPQFVERLGKNPNPVVVDFWAPWCGPCRAIEPAMKKLQGEYAGRVDVWKVNADDNPELLRSLSIYGIPTLIVFREGQEVSRRTGAQHLEGLRGLFEAGLTGEKPAPANLSSTERLLRILVATALLILAYSQGTSWTSAFIGLAGAAIFFSAVHDRCPIWQAIKPRLQALLPKGR